MKIRKVNIHDIDKLKEIGKLTFAETFSSENSEEDMRVYFAELGDKVTGYLKVNVGQSQTGMQNENTLEIERIYVLKEFHGKKVGQTLYNKAIELAKEKSVDYVWLGVWEHNPRAIRFYEKNGFVVFDKHIFKLGNDEQTDLMMKLRLKEISQLPTKTKL
jgi:ribosomal protein S18 acetylase RimI-like enzyme